MIKVFKSPQAKEKLLASYDRLLTLWDTPVEETDIPTRFGSTHVITAGDPANPPLVLFHGVGDNSALMWIYNAKALAERFRLYAVDTLGGPGKSIPGEGYNASFTQTAWLEEVFAGLNLSRFYLAGVSNGSYMAQIYAIAQPEQVERVVLMAGGPAVIAKKSSLWKTMSVFLPEALFPTDKNIIRLMTKLSGDHVDRFLSNPDLMEHWGLLLRGFNNMAMSNHKIAGFAPDQLRTLSGRTLVLVGTRDPIAWHDGLESACLEHRLDLKLFPGVGHGINHELPEVINGEIIGFLSPASVTAG